MIIDRATAQSHCEQLRLSMEALQEGEIDFLPDESLTLLAELTSYIGASPNEHYKVREAAERAERQRGGPRNREMS